MFISSVILSGLYFFFDPGVEFDLYRHYEIFHIIEKWESFSLDFTTNNSLLAQYGDSNVFYIVIVWLFSRLHIPQLIPFAAGMIIYNLQFDLIRKSLNKYSAERWKYVVAYTISLMTIDFLSISGIRNMLAVVVITYFAYIDLVEKRKRTICWIVYLLCASIHSTAILYIGIRLVVVFMNRYSKRVIQILFLSGFSVAPFFLEMVRSSVVNIPYLDSLIYLFGVYKSSGRISTEYLVLGSVVIYFLLGMTIFCYGKIKTNNSLDAYSKYGILSLLFSLGAITQINIFVRYIFAASPLLVVYISEILGLRGGIKPLSMKKVKENDFLIIMLMLSVWIGAFMYFVILGRVRYRGITAFF